MHYKLLKRCIDIIVSVGLLIFAFPILLVIYFLILIIDKQNPIFQQLRPGLNGTPFSLYKYRTMRSTEIITIELKSVTQLGLFLRKFSFDELPQLINVLKGDMSLVGPRPLLMCYLPLYSSDQFARHAVKPGITGLAQVSGRNSLDWDAKFRFDNEYVKTLSFSTDITIILKTFTILLKPQNVNVSNAVTVNPFNPTQTTMEC